MGMYGSNVDPVLMQMGMAPQMGMGMGMGMVDPTMAAMSPYAGNNRGGAAPPNTAAHPPDNFNGKTLAPSTEAEDKKRRNTFGMFMAAGVAISSIFLIASLRGRGGSKIAKNAEKEIEDHKDSFNAKSAETDKKMKELDTNLAASRKSATAHQTRATELETKNKQLEKEAKKNLEAKEKAESSVTAEQEKNAALTTKLKEAKLRELELGTGLPGAKLNTLLSDPAFKGHQWSLKELKDKTKSLPWDDKSLAKYNDVSGLYEAVIKNKPSKEMLAEIGQEPRFLQRNVLNVLTHSKTPEADLEALMKHNNWTTPIEVRDLVPTTGNLQMGTAATPGTVKEMLTRYNTHFSSINNAGAEQEITNLLGNMRTKPSS